MTVAELLSHLEHLLRFLDAGGARSLSAELQEVREGLKPFKGRTLKEFGDALRRLEQFEKRPPSEGKTPAAVRVSLLKDPAAIEELKQRVVNLYNSATNPAVTREQIVGTIGELDRLQHKPHLEDLAKRLQMTQKHKTKGEAIDAIRKKILGRKGVHERTEMS